MTTRPRRPTSSSRSTACPRRAALEADPRPARRRRRRAPRAHRPARGPARPLRPRRARGRGRRDGSRAAQAGRARSRQRPGRRRRDRGRDGRPGRPVAEPTGAAGEPSTAGRDPATTARPSVKAPLTGIFYASPAPGSAPYVQVGGEVAVGQVIGLIEAMKLFNEIKSRPGRVASSGSSRRAARSSRPSSR